MGSLTEAYDRQVSDDGEDAEVDATTRGRPYLGAALLACGTALVGAGIVLATSMTATSAVGLELIEAVELARVLAGVGLPVVFVGTLVALPVRRQLESIGVLGLVLTVAGAVAFWWAYPDRWLGDPLDLTIPVAALYLLGLLLAFGALFFGFVNSSRTRSADGSDGDESTHEHSDPSSLR